MKKTPLLTVDAVILFPDPLRVVLVQRKNPPFEGMWALPGGFVEYGERVEDAVLREVYEETGLKVRLEHFIGVFSDPERDPRGHTVSLAFLCSPVEGNLRAGDDARSVSIFDLPISFPLAFDHSLILSRALSLIQPHNSGKEK
ncbi:MAG: NUDIX domain-containing protein [bacterium JZ-2024 1]